jgi:site-specific DNA-methyltransferase (adenine-specific)
LIRTSRRPDLPKDVRLALHASSSDCADRERAKIGVYISLEAHTEPMKREAAAAGLYDGPTGKVPKIQLFTIEELFAGKTPKIPLMERGFKATAREERDDQSELEL